MPRRKSALSKKIDPRAFPDTTPIYPRPLGTRLEPVISDLLIALEKIAPGYYPLATMLVRHLDYRKHTIAEAMWAIHEACLTGALKPIDRRYYYEPIKNIVGEIADIKIVDGQVEIGELKGPAGIPITAGRLHVDNKQNDLWGILVFEINHERVVQLRFQRETATSNTGGQPPADAGGTKTEATEEISEVDLACEPLSVLQARIVKSLWPRKHAVNFDTLAQCWPNGIASDETIVKRLKDIEKRWSVKSTNDQWFGMLDLDTSPGKRTVKLFRPGQKKGQK